MGPISHLPAGIPMRACWSFPRICSSIACLRDTRWISTVSLSTLSCGHKLAVDALLLSKLQYPVALLQVFAQQYRTGTIAPKSRPVRSGVRGGLGNPTHI
jgi:hypothetical protein